jgi:hypothetical protein
LSIGPIAVLWHGHFLPPGGYRACRIDQSPKAGFASRPL